VLATETCVFTSGRQTIIEKGMFALGTGVFASAEGVLA